MSKEEQEKIDHALAEANKLNADNIPAPPPGDLGNIPPPPGYPKAYVPALV
jgi:hypothetical protein